MELRRHLGAARRHPEGGLAAAAAAAATDLAAAVALWVWEKREKRDTFASRL